MSQPTFYTPVRRALIADKFLDRFKDNPDYPFAKRTIQEIVNTIEPGRTVGTLKDIAPTLQKEIEARCKAETGKLPPLLGARGVLIRRNGEEPANGSNGHGKGHGETRPRKSSGTRVQWDQDERGKVVDAALTLWLDDPRGFDHHLFTQAAERALAPNRRRVFTGEGAIEAFRTAAVAKAKEMLANLNKPPEVQVITEQVVMPIDIPTVLDQVPIEDLAAALARKFVREKVKQMAIIPQLFAGLPTIAHAPAEPAGKGIAARIKEIEDQFPQIQVIGFRGHQHEEMVRTFKHHPVHFHKSIDPSAVLDREKLADPPAIFFVETERGASQDWRSLVLSVTGTDASRRNPCHGASRVYHQIKELAGTWAAKNQALLTEWKLLRGR